MIVRKTTSLSIINRPAFHWTMRPPGCAAKYRELVQQRILCETWWLLWVLPIYSKETIV